MRLPRTRPTLSVISTVMPGRTPPAGAGALVGGWRACTPPRSTTARTSTANAEHASRSRSSLSLLSRSPRAVSWKLATFSLPAPTRVGLRRCGDSATAIDDVLNRARADSAFPGAIAVVGTRDGIIAEYAVGQLDWAPSPVPDEHTLWDLASLTKVVGLTSGDDAARRASIASISTRRCSATSPTWTGPNKDRVTVRHLLTHTSGLPSFKAYDEITHDPDSLAKLMFSTPLDTLPGAQHGVQRHRRVHARASSSSR